MKSCHCWNLHLYTLVFQHTSVTGFSAVVHSCTPSPGPCSLFLPLKNLSFILETEQQQSLCKHPVNSSTEVHLFKRHGNLGFLFVAAKSNLQSHNAGLMAYFCCMMFLQELAGTGCCVAALTTRERWSEQHLVKSNSAALQGGWVGSVFFPLACFASLLFCSFVEVWPPSRMLIVRCSRKVGGNRCLLVKCLINTKVCKVLWLYIFT